MHTSEPVTATVARLLHAAGTGDFHAAEDLVPVLYGELHNLARGAMLRERPGQTLQATALVHEAYLRLVHGDQRWQGRAHFLGAAARAMRRILVERARRRLRLRHGGGMQRREIPSDLPEETGAGYDTLALDEALQRLDRVDHRKSEVVHLRHFAGLTLEEVGEVLGLSLSTVKADWSLARAWLKRELVRGDEPENGS